MFYFMLYPQWLKLQQQWLTASQRSVIAAERFGKLYAEGWQRTHFGVIPSKS